MQISSAFNTLPPTLADALRRNAAARAASAAAGSDTAAEFSLSAETSTAGAPAPASFGGALDQALRAVSASQAEATRLSEGVLRDPGQVSLEETMVATQKAQIGFQSALHVRNRLVSAYSDIMNMQV